MQLSHHLPRTPYICASCTRRLAHTSARPQSFRPSSSSYHSNAATTSPVSPNSRSLRNPSALHSSSTLIPQRHAYQSHAYQSHAYQSHAHQSHVHQSPVSQRHAHQSHAYSTTTTRPPLRLAIIGSGPAGFYTAHRLLSKLPSTHIDMYEQLPTPYGLVRYGVAPDHPDVKNCQSTFRTVAHSPNFTYIGNVRVGSDISLARMRPHYDGILFAYGASEDRKLGIEGEELRGVYSAREFVGWYNGLPQFSGLEPDLGRGGQAVVVGQGNVALDVARILLTSVDVLRRTDITERALEVLGRSRVRSVKVVGRRGPLQAAFTVKEVRELMNIQDLAFEPIDTSLFPPDIKNLPRVQRRIAEVLQKGTKTDVQNSAKKWGLGFLKAPKAMHASDSTHISSITFANQSFAPDTDPYSKSASVVSTGEESTLPADLAFRSVGYKSASIPGLDELGVPFDTKLGIIPNDPYGRVITPSTGPGSLTAGHVHGLYCAGWVKRGPTGVIASTMEDAFTSADVIAHDWESDVPFLNNEGGENRSTGLGWDGIKEQVLSKGVRPLSWSNWERIDEMEVERGQRVGKPREKFESVEEMLEVLDA